MTTPRESAPGRYCLATCYCGECDHYVPIRRHDAEEPRAESVASVVYLPTPKGTT